MKAIACSGIVGAALGASVPYFLVLSGFSVVGNILRDFAFETSYLAGQVAFVGAVAGLVLGLILGAVSSSRKSAG